MLNGINAVNEAALVALRQNDFYRAQTLFRENVKENTCHASLNNLGVFYVYEGLFKSDNSCRKANSLGVSYLKKAEVDRKSCLTLRALGNAFFEVADYKKASDSFRHACELKHDYASMYNLALSLYRQNRFDDALIWFEKALNDCETPDRAETYTAYMFSLLQVDKDKCREKLSRFLEGGTEHMEVDKFILAYLCDDLQAAEGQIKPMIEHYWASLEEMAMVFDCLIKLNKREAAAIHLKLKIEMLLESDYNMRSEIMNLKKAFSDDEYRNEIISSFRFVQPLVVQCCYYGCKQHNPL